MSKVYLNRAVPGSFNTEGVAMTKKKPTQRWAAASFLVNLARLILMLVCHPPYDE